MNGFHQVHHFANDGFPVFLDNFDLFEVRELSNSFLKVCRADNVS